MTDADKQEVRNTAVAALIEIRDDCVDVFEAARIATRALVTINGIEQRHAVPTHVEEE